MELACGVLRGHFGPVYLIQISKNDDEKCCFLEEFGLRHCLLKLVLCGHLGAQNAIEEVKSEYFFSYFDKVKSVLDVRPLK